MELRSHFGVNVVVWNDRVENEETLHRVKKERSIHSTIKRGKTNCIGCMSHGNRLLKYIIEGRIEGKRRKRRRGQQLIADFKENIRC